MNADWPPPPKIHSTSSFVSPVPASEHAIRRHEQMNALSVISSVASLVGPGLSGPDRARMDRLKRAVSRLEDLIRTDADDAHDPRAEPARATVDVETLVRGVCERLRHRAEAAGIRLVVTCGGGLLQGDEVALRETLLNLVGNAIETTAEGRGVHLETHMTDLGDQVWTIRNSSNGLPAGVMLSASIAMSHGGSLAFESRKGEGTTVRVWLPREGRKGDMRKASSGTFRAADVLEFQEQT